MMSAGFNIEADPMALARMRIQLGTGQVMHPDHLSEAFQPRRIGWGPIQHLPGCFTAKSLH